MNILITGGSGFIGRHLTQSLLTDGHQVWILSRAPQKMSVRPGIHLVGWDGRSDAGWGHLVNEMDAIVNLAGKSLASWPWTAATKQAFWDSRIQPGEALVTAIHKATRRPRVLIQSSGINHYGLHGDLADESTPPADDFLARLTVAWEASTRPVEDLGVRRVITRSAVVLARQGGLMPLMALPVRLFLGGPLGTGQQAMPWIHVDDEVNAMRFLLENEQANGPFNLIAPHATSNAEFFRTLARALRRPYWFPTPAFLLRLILGGMSSLILDGRFARPKRLLELGYTFKFPRLEDALSDIFPAKG
jgi:uncharacterized protein (TIGR01777 family)